MSKAVFTMVHNEGYFLPLWLNYYSKSFNVKDIYVLDDGSNDGSTDNLDVNVVKLDGQLSFDHAFMSTQVRNMQIELLKGYQTVTFSEIDEFVVPHPNTGLILGEYIDNMEEDYVRCTGWNIVQGPHEGPINLDAPIMRQRRFGYKTEHRRNTRSKVLISKVPLCWRSGQHNRFGLEEKKNLLLIHLHWFDKSVAWERLNHRVMRDVKLNEVDGKQNRFMGGKKEFVRKYFKSAKKTLLPPRFRAIDIQ